MAECDFESFIREQDARNTIKGNNLACRTFTKFISSVGEKRPVESIPPIELDRLLSRFFMEVVRVDGMPYQPDVLSTIHRGLKRYLDTKNYGKNILKDDIFDKSRKVLAARRKKLKRDGYGGNPNACRGLSEDEINELWKRKYFGIGTGESVQRGVWYLLSLHCGWRGCDEARQLCWNDISLEYDQVKNVEYLLWKVERGSKTRVGREGEACRKYDPTLYPSGNSRCPIQLFKLFEEHRPESTMVAGYAFFLGINWKKTVTDSIWYTDRPMGRNYLSKILPEAKKLFNLPGKVANHSVRKTGISRLLDADVPEIFVAQHSGMKNTDSLKAYKSASKKHQIRMSDILNEKDVVSDQVVISSQQSNSSVDARSTGLFSGAVFNNCTFNMGTVEPSYSNSSKESSTIVRRRFRFFSSSDEEDLFN